MKFEADEKKLVKELAILICLQSEIAIIKEKNPSIKQMAFSSNYPELYWKVFIPAKISTKKVGEIN